MTNVWTYRQDQELPSFAVAWYDNADALINFSSGYTFTVKLVDLADGTVALTKTTNISGAATSPNVTVAWAAGELSTLTARHQYAVHLVANNGAGTDRVFRPGNPPTIRITATPT